MAQHACISIGINRYQCFQPLSFAAADAGALVDFFGLELGWNPDNCLLMTDNSPPSRGSNTYPNLQNIQTWLEKMCWEILQPGDFLWLFFSGYGINTGNAEYLMPIDGDSQAIPRTGISIANLYRQLSAPGIQVMVVLDVNRSQSVDSGQGFGSIVTRLAQEFSIPTFLSCQSDEFAQEAMGLKHGIFTAALLEALRFNPELSISSLQSYLASRVPELSAHHWRPLQHPVAIMANNGTVFRPIFASPVPAASAGFEVGVGHRPEPSRRRSPVPATSSSALALYEAPAPSKHQAALPDRRKPITVGFVGMIIVLVFLITAVWKQANTKTVAPTPAAESPLQQPPPSATLPVP